MTTKDLKELERLLRLYRDEAAGDRAEWDKLERLRLGVRLDAFCTMLLYSYDTEAGERIAEGAE